MKKIKEGLSQDFEAESTFSFDDTGREEYRKKMASAGYVELPSFAGKEDNYHYNCFNCEHFKADPESPTTFWCEKFSFPDRAHGCCDGWELAPDMQDQGESDPFEGAGKFRESIKRSSKYWAKRRPEPELTE